MKNSGNLELRSSRPLLTNVRHMLQLREKAKNIDKKIAHENDRWTRGQSWMSPREWQRLLEHRQQAWAEAEGVSPGAFVGGSMASARAKESLLMTKDLRTNTAPNSIGGGAGTRAMGSGVLSEPSVARRWK